MSGSGRRLNMDHGFMQCIIKNQVDRDNYDKEMKAKAQKAQRQQAKTKKPDQQPYVPPTTRPPRLIHKDRDSGKSFLFKLEYEDQNKGLHYLTVHKQDDPMTLANRFGQEQGLSVPMTRALADILQDEMEKSLKAV